jgi:hypothetical protein
MIADAARAFVTKLSGATPRERAGAAILAAIAAITAAVYAVDWAGASAREAEEATQSVSDVAALESVFADEGYRRVIASEAGKVWRLSRTADALAGEEIVTELEALGMQAGFGDPRVTLLEQTSARGRVGALEASISAEFDWSAFLAFLEALESSELSYAVRSIDISEGDSAQRMTLVVSAPLIDGENAS